MKLMYSIIVFISTIPLIQPLTAQEKIIEIRQAGGSKQDQESFPGANILFKNSKKRVLLFHEDALKPSVMLSLLKVTV